MKKPNIIRPTGLKGNDKLNRMRELMGTTPINEGTSRSVIELTKKGPDGKSYAIVRENHEYYIKIAGEPSGENGQLMAEDFNYMGGLQNKKSESHESYAKAAKQLNLKFLGLNEAFGGPRVNVLKNDNLLTENATAAGSMGFVEEEVIDEVEDMNGKKAPVDNDTSGDNVAGSKVDNDDESPIASSTNVGDHKAGEKGHDTHIIGEDVELSEDESAIDEMITGESEVVEEETIEETVRIPKLRIAEAVNMMDDVIAEATGERVDDIMSTLSKSEQAALLEALKKKA